MGGSMLVSWWKCSSPSRVTVSSWDQGVKLPINNRLSATKSPCPSPWISIKCFETVIPGLKLAFYIRNVLIECQHRVECDSKLLTSVNSVNMWGLTSWELKMLFFKAITYCLEAPVELHTTRWILGGREMSRRYTLKFLVWASFISIFSLGSQRTFVDLGDCKLPILAGWRLIGVVKQSAVIDWRWQILTCPRLSWSVVPTFSLNAILDVNPMKWYCCTTKSPESVLLVPWFQVFC